MQPQQVKNPVLVARSRLAHASRNGHPAVAEQARQELVAAKLERSIREALASTPSLTAERRVALSELLVGGESA